jgi:hypothetical protein
MKWRLDVSTFKGVVAYAQHYVGYLQPPDKRSNPNIFGGEHGWPPDKVAVESELTAEYAKRLSTDDFTYREGWLNGRYFSYDEVVAQAIVQFQELAEPGDTLVGYRDDLTDDDPAVLAAKEA